MLQAADIIDDGAAVALRWQDGRKARFHAFWLIDASLDPETRHPTNGQRLITVEQVPLDARIANATISADRLHVEFYADGRRLVFEGSWLAERIYDNPRTDEHFRLMPGKDLWDGVLAEKLKVHLYPDVIAEPTGRVAWLSDIHRYGLARLSGVPATPGSVTDVVALFGHVRETNYGRTFQVRSEVSPSNLAYTNAGLQAHTDNPYRDPVPTVQLLCCLENDVEGGESLAVDGFKAAEVLRDESPDGFLLLSRFNARFAYAGQEGVCLASRRPMIEVDADGTLRAIRFNSRSVAPLEDIPFDEMAAYYAAYRHFSEIIDRPEMAVTFKLSPGDLFIVDNTRVLHARTAFSGTGSRHLEGCYADMDGVLSTLETLVRKTGYIAA